MSELPSGWTEANLLDICQPKQWKVISTAELTDSGYVVYGANGKIGFYSTYTHEKPTLMITCRGATCGNLHISEPRAYINGNAMALDDLAEEVTSISYFKYALQARGLTDVITGSAQPQITRQNLSEATIKLAPLAEQTRIAQKLDELLAQVDTLKARIDAIPALLKRFRQSVFAAAVSGQLTVQRKSTDLPSGWQRVKFSSVIDDLRYGTAQKCDYNGGATGVLRIPNISENGINIDDLKYSNFSETENKKLSLRKGDVVLIRSNGSVSLVGRSAVIGSKEEGLLFAGYLIRARINIEKAIPEYVNYWLKSPAIRQDIELTARSTSGVNNINSEEIKSLTFTMPSLAEQTEIVDRVKQLFAFADQLEAKVASAKNRIDHLTQSILAKAFRGELVPQDPNDEPASVLLERIKAQRAAAPKAKRGRKASA
ncbi:restriction endonuclease subunit S [Pseudomonas sp. IT-P4]|uniref:restriction endonuclease subunit S n=1 Tax=Pseudomonas sp. IT-P4 TaxID=3026446 RepID=UPI0039E15CF1